MSDRFGLAIVGAGLAPVTCSPGAVRAGRPLPSNGHSALNAHALIDAMTRSSASAKRERIT
jgi:hypothetical protein